MNTHELLAALKEAGVDGYSICGHTGPSGLDEGMIYLDKSHGEWVFGNYQRGTYTPLRTFASEDEACSYVYGYLTKSRPGPRIRTQEERAADEARARQVLEELAREREE